MFAFPAIDSVPTLNFVGAQTITLSSLGTILAWAVIAALVGSILGLLREYTSPQASGAAPAGRRSMVIRFEPPRTNEAQVPRRRAGATPTRVERRGGQGGGSRPMSDGCRPGAGGWNRIRIAVSDVAKTRVSGER